MATLLTGRERCRENDVEFAPADFSKPHNVMILTKVLTLVEHAAYKSMLEGKPELLLEAA